MKFRIAMMALLGSASLIAASSAGAEVLKWTLVDAVFDDGGTASGSFDFNTVTLAYTDVNITTTAGGELPGATYTVENPYTVPRDYGFGSLVSLSDNAQGDPSLDINTITDFDTPGTVSIGSIDGFVSSEGVCYEDTCDLYSPIRSLSGSVFSSLVPEPATWAMMLAGLGGIGGMMRAARRRGATITA